MPQENVFAEQWRECLREHYKHVVKNDPNPRNLVSVKKAFLQPNREQPPIFTEDELHQLYIEATMRADEMPDDFVPELLLEEVDLQPSIPPVEADEPTFQPHPLECQCPSCIEIDLKPHDTEGQPLSTDAIAEIEEEVTKKKRGKKEAAPQQLSLF
jgi:hypothetical protein